MQSKTWISLLQRIPAAHHNILVVVTAAGTEISVQTVARLEEEFLVIRGRLSGTTDAGRVFFIPYNQINYLGYQREVKESEVQALFDGPEPMQAPVKAKAANGPPPEPIIAVVANVSRIPPETDTPAVPSDKPNSEPRLSIPRKSGILARLRARTHNGIAEAPPKP